MINRENPIDSLLAAILDCLKNTSPGIDAQLTAIVDCFMQSPEISASLNIKIGYKKRNAQSIHYLKTDYTIKEDLIIGQRIMGFIEIACPDEDWANTASLKSLVKALGSLLVILIEKHRIRLRVKKKQLALGEILAQIEKEKNEIKDSMQANIKKLILPALDRLKSDNLSAETRKQYLGVLEGNLKELFSNFVSKTNKDNVKLSPREMEIINLISNGLHTKEIAQILQISVLTVERHRFNIRKKLGIKKHQINLQSFLQQY